MSGCPLLNLLLMLYVPLQFGYSWNNHLEYVLLQASLSALSSTSSAEAVLMAVVHNRERTQLRSQGLYLQV